MPVHPIGPIEAAKGPARPALSRLVLLVTGALLAAAGSFVSVGGTASRARATAGRQPSLAAPATTVAPTPDGAGAWIAAGDGGVLTEGDAGYFGSMGGQHLNAPVVGMAPTHDGKGYWLVAADGGLFSFGDAGFLGSTGGMHLNAPIVAMTASSDGRGYRFVASDGGVFSFGDARFYGSAGNLRLVQPIVGMAADPATGGYWLVASDGGVFSYDAPFFGSTGGMALQRPIVAMAPTPDGGGYWLLGADGGVFCFGDASFFGANPGAGSAVSLAGTSDGHGYWVLSGQGSLAAFGDARRFSSLAVTSGPYAFEQTNDDGTPSRWNPCAPIRYVVNTSEAPSNALSLISSALSSVSAATGLQFSYQGTSSEWASRERPLTQNGQWAPVLIVWQQPSQGDYLPSGGENGMGGFTAVTNPGGRWVDVTGQVAFNVAAPGTQDFTQSGGWTHLVLHELGHLVGLGHVSDTAQVMYPVAVAGSATAYGSGDLSGLSQLGSSGGCLTEPSPAGW